MIFQDYERKDLSPAEKKLHDRLVETDRAKAESRGGNGSPSAAKPHPERKYPE